MKKILISLGIASLVGIAAVALMADEHEGFDEAHEDESHGSHDRDDDHAGRHRATTSGYGYLSDAQYALYKDECGACHVAYPPFTLPATSWQGMMTSLEQHFGDNAELDPATATTIADFLARHAAGKGGGEYGERTWRATRGRPAPQRITETDYFRGQHHEIPAKMVTGNPQVVSFSRCETCHSGAERGDFSEHGVRIPGFGRWDD